MRIKEIYAKDVPAMVESAERWMRDETSDGAGSMLSYFYGMLERDGVRVGPDEVSKRLSRAQAKRCADSLHVADCYAVSKEKTLDVLEAAQELPGDMSVRREYFDTDNGFMVFECGYMALTGSNEVVGQGDNVRVSAISWRIFGGKMHIYIWTRTDDYLEAVRNLPEHRSKTTMSEVRRRVAIIGPLVVCGEHAVSVDSFMRRSKIIQRRWKRESLSVLLAACLMLRQEITARSVIDAPRGLYKFGQRLDLNATRPVTIIDKRSIKANPTNEDLPEKTGKRQLTVRYDVRGHWRVYKSERFSPEVREHPIWIPAHWVGDESLPIVDRKKVTRLKR